MEHIGTFHSFLKLLTCGIVKTESSESLIWSPYRRGAPRWRKQYRVNGHLFQAKRFNRRSSCALCEDKSLGSQGFKCVQCKIMVHKKCHKLLIPPCSSLRQDHQKFQGAETQVVSQESDQPQSYSSPFEISANLEVNVAKLSVDHEYSCDGKSADNHEKSSLKIADGPDGPGEVQRQYSLNDFELIKVIGRGSFAKVLMVELKGTRRIYAMKVIKKALFNDEEDIDCLQTEKHVFQTVTNYPFLVGLHSCFQSPSRLFFVIEFIRGGDLLYHMQRLGRLAEEHARFYAAEICLALNFLHEKGIIYRDLKLDNVLLDHEGHVKLTDYGMCKEGILRESDTAGTFCGTPTYIAPEILQGAEYRFSVDWWALGVLLYEMLAGCSPFCTSDSAENPDQNTVDYIFQMILEKTIRIPRTLSWTARSILKGFLCKDPNERLGCGPGSFPFQDIVNHRFFQAIDWKMLEAKKVAPPFRPSLKSDRDLKYFPAEFTDLPVSLTPDDPTVIAKLDQTEFEGFDYVNPARGSAK